MMSSSDKCQICKEELGDNEELIIAVKTQNGVDTINTYSRLRGFSWSAVVNQRFHKNCRKNFVNKSKLKMYQPFEGDPKNVKAVTRSSISSSSKFDYRTCCLFCAEQICRRVDQSVELISKKKEDADSISFVKTKVSFDQTLRKKLKDRTDDWSFEVRGRVESVSCLRSEEAVYHRNCYQLFNLGRRRCVNIFSILIRSYSY